MTKREGPMPLSELPEYMRRARENGQGDDVPVVDMGMIVDESPAWGWINAARYAVAACVLLAAVGVGTVASRTESVTIRSDAGPGDVARIVSEEGGSVFSVSRREDGDYEVRVFSFRGFGSLLDRIRGNKEIKRAEMAD